MRIYFSRLTIEGKPIIQAGTLTFNQKEAQFTADNSFSCLTSSGVFTGTDMVMAVLEVVHAGNVIQFEGYHHPDKNNVVAYRDRWHFYITPPPTT
jgi:hypothetical protein